MSKKAMWHGHPARAHGQDGRATVTVFLVLAVLLLYAGTLIPTTNVFTISVASGTASLGTSAISSGSCASVVTVSASGVATTDTIKFTPNADPTSVTGYGASSSGAVLSVYAYPTANNVNFKVCNSTGSSITPGSMTLNWEVTR